MRDLVILVADKNMQFSLRGALERHQALGIKRIELQDSDFITHSARDGGVRTTGADLLKLKKQGYRHALMVLDHEGCGSDQNPEKLEEALTAKLRETWGEKGRAIVISPELDVWMWGNDNLLQQVFGWNLQGGIRDWLKAHDFAFDTNGKPHRPKEAMERLMRELKQPRSSAWYREIAEKISLSRCKDHAFQRLRIQLRLWFPAQ